MNRVNRSDGVRQWFLLLLLLWVWVQNITTYVVTENKEVSWCDAVLCPGGQQHLACNNDVKFHARCQPDSVMLDLDPHRAQLLHEHNRRRNFIAAGQLPGYYAAARMATMQWDKELEYLATLNLRTCDLEHDDCNHSYRFRNVGQNLLGVAHRRTARAEIEHLIRESLRLWFGEFPLIDSSYMTEFRASENLDKYGHFAQIVVERATHVGCAMMRFTNPDYPFLYIYNTACNYASTYAIGVPVYRAGEPASQCKTGANPFYPALCSLMEKFNPNYN